TFPSWEGSGVGRFMESLIRSRQRVRVAPIYWRRIELQSCILRAFFLFGGWGSSLPGSGVSRHRVVAFAEIRWFDPVTLPFERISRQGQPMPLFLRVKARPRDRQACQPEPAQRAEHRRLIKRLLFRAIQRSTGHLTRAGGRVLPRQLRQGLTGTDLQEDSLLSPPQFSQPIGEANRLPQVRRPVIRIARLRRS